MKTPCVLALVGPTASGKTNLSLLLAERLNAEIVSADSRQVFKYLDIGTAKPSRSDRDRTPHHLVDFVEPTEAYSAGQFGVDARNVIGEIAGRGLTPLLVGGSGLYIKAVIDGLSNLPGVDREIRTQLRDEYLSGGLDPLLKELQQVDPATLLQTTQLNVRRVLRALEIYRMTGKPLSQFHAEQVATGDSLEVFLVGLRWRRSELAARIAARVDGMLKDGLVEETRGLLESGYDRRLNALNTVGYKEVCEFLEGALDHDTMVELVNRNTRRFAKRQTTWFNADNRIHWFDVSGSGDWSLTADLVVKKFLEASSQTTL